MESRKYFRRERLLNQLVCTATLSGLLSTAVGQEMAPAQKYDGTWYGKGPNLWDTTLTMNGSTGSWKVYAPASSKFRFDAACLKATRPITLLKSTESELVIMVNGSQAVTGCEDVEIVLKKTQNGTLERTVAGNTMTFVRDSP